MGAAPIDQTASSTGALRRIGRGCKSFTGDVRCAGQASPGLRASDEKLQRLGLFRALTLGEPQRVFLQILVGFPRPLAAQRILDVYTQFPETVDFLLGDVAML